MSIKINTKIIKLMKYYSYINHKFFYSNKAINRYDFKDYSIKADIQKELEKLKLDISKIGKCELKNNATNLVFADGNPNSKILIIGEGPGANEDIEGLPFVGRAGKLLDKMLGSIGLNRKNVYITNVVNYRPPENRKPTELEIKRYLPFLFKHIEIINPKILILLGSTALNAIIGDKVVISKARGKWYKKKIGSLIIDVIPSFHPAFLMRQPEQKKLAWVDLKMVREKIKNLKIKIV